MPASASAAWSILGRNSARRLIGVSRVVHEHRDVRGCERVDQVF